VKKTVLAIGLVSMLFGFNASAQKIGIVDINKVMSSSKDAASIKSELEAKYKPREQKLLGEQKAIQEEIKKLQRDDSIMTEAQKKSLQEKIMAYRKNFEAKGRSFQQEVNAAQSQAMKNLFDKVKVVVDTVAKNNKFDVVFQKDAVQYIAPGNDITAKVIAKLK